MAKRTAKTVDKQDKPKKREKFGDYKNSRWVLNNLDETQLLLMDNTDFDLSRAMEWVESLVDEGMELKFTWDTYSNCYQANIFGSFMGFTNTGYGVSARSDSFEDIIKILWFKFDYLCERDLTQAYEPVTRSKRRG